jgi:hypothetical protein
MRESREGENVFPGSGTGGVHDENNNCYGRWRPLIVWTIGLRVAAEQRAITGLFKGF